MTVIKKSDVARPVRKKETIEVAELGGEVVIRQMTLQQYLEMVRYGMAHDHTTPMARLLADCVVDVDELPIFDENEWDVWSTAHIMVAFSLYEKLRRLSGLDVVEESEKN